MNKILISSAAAVTLTVAAFSLVSPQAEAEDQAAEVVKPSYELITVESSSIGGEVILGGAVIPYKTVNLSAQMPGDVKFIAGEEGDTFKKGDILVSLDTDALMAKRRQAETQYWSAEAGYRNAMVQYNREMLSPNSQANSMLGGAPSMFSVFSDPIRSFSGEGDPSYERHSNLYGMNVQVQTARNQMEQALAAIAELDANLINAVSIAPFDGVILKKMAEVGDIIQPGMPLVTFADVSKMQIQVEVPSNLLGMITKGAKINARLDGSKELFPAVVERIFPSADMGGHTTTVKFDLLDASKARSGMYVEVMIPDPNKTNRSLPVIPESAIVWTTSLPGVFILDEQGNPKLRLIRIGERTADGKVSIISGGIKAGDQILARPQAGFQPGA
jgi:multidrug efflux pump subunit AcrA (membrane-fusion protein)